MKIIHSIVLFTIVFNFIFAKSANKGQTKLNIKKTEVKQDHSVAHGIASNGGFYLANAAVKLYF